MHVLLAGGGTAGHVEPALATADALRRLDPAIEVTMLGTARGLETRLVPERGYHLDLVPPVPLPRGLRWELAGVPRRLTAAVAAAAEVLDRRRVDVVVGFGGYVAVPAYLAAQRRHRPVVVHEANARAGLANRLGARLPVTVTVATAAPSRGLPGALQVGMPLRRAVAGLDRLAQRTAAAQRWGLDPARPTLLVFGGSQGARRLNVAAVAAARALTDAGVQVLHATGQDHADGVAASLAAAGVGQGYVSLPYIDDMPAAYAASDLALCRCGAMTVAELCAVGLPGVYVPLPIGNGEQRLNAAPVVAAGGGLLVDDAGLDGDSLLRDALPLLTDAPRLAAMAAVTATLGIRDADEQLARLVLAAG